MVRDTRLYKVYGSKHLSNHRRAHREASVDLSKFKTSDWLKVGGAAVVLIAYFLDWSSFDCGGSSACDSSNFSGSSFFFRGTLPWLLIVAVATEAA